MKSKIKVYWGELIYSLINLGAFVGAVSFVANTFMQSEKGIQSIMFGAMVLLVMTKYVCDEIRSANPIRRTK